MAAHSPPSSEHGGQCRAAGGALQWLTTRLRSSPFALNIELLVGGLEHYIYIYFSHHIGNNNIKWDFCSCGTGSSYG